MKYIKITKNRVAIVDDEDYEKLSEYSWYSGRNYAYTCIKGYCVNMARIILKLEKGDGKQVDHINHNGLDNRRCNIRIATQSQNNANRRPQGGSSVCRGVHWSKLNKKWRAMIQKNGKKYHIGLYYNEKEASIAYKKRAIEMFGDFACVR